MQNFEEALSQIKQELEALKILPKEIEFSRFADFHFSNIAIETKGLIISESIVCGFDRSPQIALMKSLSEYIEALSFQSGRNDNVASCQTERSDGFAAFPKFNPDYQHRARENAYAEAIERFIWATWWDGADINYETEDIDFRKNDGPGDRLLRELSKSIEIESVTLVKPKFHASNQLELWIFLAFLKDGGVISGGACGKSTEVEIRALSELIRHGLAAMRFRKTGQVPASFYERRLCHFLTESGERTVRERLSKVGQTIVELPPLQTDLEVPSVAPKSFYVHRCLFKNQPPFIGGAVERFCL